MCDISIYVFEWNRVITHTSMPHLIRGARSCATLTTNSKVDGIRWPQPVIQNKHWNCQGISRAVGSSLGGSPPKTLSRSSFGALGSCLRLWGALWEGLSGSGVTSFRMVVAKPRACMQKLRCAARLDQVQRIVKINYWPHELLKTEIGFGRNRNRDGIRTHPPDLDNRLKPGRGLGSN